MRRLKILVADDEAAIRRFVSTVLIGTGFDVNTASDGQEAWEALQREPYDLLVTDNEMPRLDGLKLVELIRTTGFSLPIIIASGTLSAEGAGTYPRHRIAALLTKPFGIGELVNTVRGVLDASCALR